MSNFIDYAKRELTNAGLFEEDSDYGGELGDAVMELVKTFHARGHSGFSGPRTIYLFSQLARWMPLTPLTGEDDEWTEVTEGVYQNKRMSSIFKDGKDGQAYWIDGLVFRDQHGHTFTSGMSRVPVNFPWYPCDPQVVDVYVDPERGG